MRGFLCFIVLGCLLIKIIHFQVATAMSVFQKVNQNTFVIGLSIIWHWQFLSFNGYFYQFLEFVTEKNWNVTFNSKKFIFHSSIFHQVRYIFSGDL